MPIHSTQPTRPTRPVRELRRRAIYHREEPNSRSSTGYAMGLLLLLALIVVCIVGFVLIRALFSDSSQSILPAFVTRTPSAEPTGPGPQPTPPGGRSGQNEISIEPQQGYINTLVTVTGWGWWPGEPVFVFLRSPGEGDGPGYAYAAAVADEQGNARTAFTFPNEARWLEAQWADVIARGTRSGFEAGARFSLVAPTPTSTLAPPTALPTRLSTDTPPPSDTPLPTPTVTPPLITDWLGEYFANTTLAGDPVIIRNDATVDFAWDADSPGQGVPADRFSARWTRLQHFRESSYRFTVASDDGVRLWIDGQLLVDDWQDGPLMPHTFDLSLSRGEHALHIEYYENLGQAGIQFDWERIEAPPATATPTSTSPPLPTDTPSPTPEPTDTPSSTPEPTDTPVPTATLLPPPPDTWQAEYYANPTLSGEPVMVREDAEVNFDWGAGSPGEGVPPDGFSARWTREVWVAGGTYRVFLEVDDGARLWIDGQLLIDAWHIATGEAYVVEIDLSDGIHTMKVEYFEAVLDAWIRLWAEKVPGSTSMSPQPGF